MDSLVKLVGKNIREIRKSKNLTQDDLAEKCDLQTSYLAGVERGERNVTLQTLEKIITGIDESPVNIFKFDSSNINMKDLEKKELVKLLLILLEHKSKDEVKLILNISNSIFNTYHENS